MKELKTGDDVWYTTPKTIIKDFVSAVGKDDNDETIYWVTKRQRCFKRKELYTSYHNANLNIHA